MKLFAHVVLFFLAAIAPFPAFSQNVTADLYHGQNEDIPNDVPATHPLRPSLNQVMGYRFYHRIGRDSCNLSQKREHMLQPHKMFPVHLRRLDRQELEIEFFQKRRSLVKSRFIPKPHKPLLITGPWYQNGQLVLVLTSGTQAPPSRMPKPPVPQESVDN